MTRIALTALLAVALLIVAIPLTALAAEPFRLCTPERQAELVSMIPRTDDLLIEKVRRDPRLVVYTDKEMPKASQFWDNNPLAGVHLASNNISANPTYFTDKSISGGPGQEFPWRVPFGLDDAKTHWGKFTFYLLPVCQPIRYWRERLPGDAAKHACYRWQFPIGTVFGEVLHVQDSEGYSWPFELRVRRKISEGTWRPDIFRPFRTRTEYDTAVAAEGESPGSSNPRLRTLRNHHPVKVISRVAVEDVLSALRPEVVKRLLNRVFKSIRGEHWSDVADGPTSQATFGVVPQNYAGAALLVTANNCAKCHATTLKHPDAFDRPGRDWYGRVPGDDQIMTWHPFALSSVSRLGTPQPVSLHQAMIKAGHVKAWDTK